MIVILVLNIVAVSWYGEAEFWFATLRIIAIIGLIILGIVLFFDLVIAIFVALYIGHKIWHRTP